MTIRGLGEPSEKALLKTGVNSTFRSLIRDHSGLAKQINKFHWVLQWLLVLNLHYKECRFRSSSLGSPPLIFRTKNLVHRNGDQVIRN